MDTVTRFICNKNLFDAEKLTLTSGVFYTLSNKQYGEISVFDIDKELKNGNDEAIFKIGDKEVYKKPGKTIARADMQVEHIKKIKTNEEHLYIVKNMWSKHCNIRPFPQNDALALNIAGQLVKISSLKVR